jgi:hypothetical protein
MNLSMNLPSQPPNPSKEKSLALLKMAVMRAARQEEARRKAQKIVRERVSEIPGLPGHTAKGRHRRIFTVCRS